VKRCAEIRISKSEIRNNIKTMKTQRQNNVQKQTKINVLDFPRLVFLTAFVSDFVLRISNFDFGDLFRILRP